MCGEIDEQVVIGQEMLDRMRATTRKLDLPEGGPASATPQGLSDPEGRAGYMEATFREGLTRALADIAAAEEDETVDALALRAIALARLAGYLAGQLPPEADLFRALIEAVSAGHAEAREATHALLHAQDHHHHHDDHDHSHDHGHHHH